MQAECKKIVFRKNCQFPFPRSPAHFSPTRGAAGYCFPAAPHVVFDVCPGVVYALTVTSWVPGWAIQERPSGVATLAVVLQGMVNRHLTVPSSWRSHSETMVP